MTITEESARELTTGLAPGHRAELAASAIAPEQITARGYETLIDTPENRRRLKDLRIPGWAWREESAWPGLLLPMYRATGELISFQWKPAVPQARSAGDERPQKYASPVGSLHLDVPPLASEVVRDGRTPLWITEGIKKADCLASQGRAAITLTGVFNWRSKAGTLGDWEDIQLRNRSVVVCFDSDARENRNVLMAMRRLGRWLESKGVTSVRYLIVPSETPAGVPVKGVDDWFAAGGTMPDLGDAAMRELPVDGPDDAQFSDSVLTDTLCSEELEGCYRWASGLGWLRWTGRVWEGCTDAAVAETVRLWAIEQFQQVLSQQRADPNRRLSAQIDGWRAVLGGSKQTTLLRMARGVMECAAEDFDSDPYLLNCPNGVVDLRTGTLTPADPDLLMTKVAGADYVKGATHPDWDKALTALPEEVRGWFQLRMGQGITGFPTPDGVCIVSQGGGANGKSTVVNGITRALGTTKGGYWVAVADRAMLGAASENHPTEMMDFMGARFALLEETPESRQLDTVRLKKLMDTEHITARRIRQDSVTFPATHTLVINSNYRPVIIETDHGTWRRLALLRWPYTYRRTQAEVRGTRDRLGDSTLGQRLKSDPRAAEAVLAWLVEGARSWFLGGTIMPPPPELILRDTLAWRRESDPILGFVEDEIVFDPSSHVLSTELFAAFTQWLQDRNNKPWSDRTFSSRFGAHDLVSQHGVYAQKLRARAGLSRPGGSSSGTTATPKIYAAWVGIRFRPQADPGGDGDDPFGPVAPNDDPSLTCDVPAVPASGITYVSLETFPSYGEPEQPEHDLAQDPFRGPSNDLPTPSEALPETMIQTIETDIPGGPAPRTRTASAAPPNGFRVDATKPLVFDIESADADTLYTARGGFVRLNGVSDGTAAITTPDAQEMLDLLDAAPEISGHNIMKFDLPALARHEGADYDALARKAVDTLVLARLADPPGSRGQKPWSEKGYYGLDAVCRRLELPHKTDDLPALALKHAVRALDAVQQTTKAGDPKNTWTLGTGEVVTTADLTKRGYSCIPVDDPEYNEYLRGDLAASAALRAHYGEPTDYARREMRVMHLQHRMTLSGWRVDIPLLKQRAAEEEEHRTERLAWLAGHHGLPVTKQVTRGRGEAKTAPEVPVASPLSTTAGLAWLEETWKRFGVARPPRTGGGRLKTAKDDLAQVRNHPKCPPDLAEILDAMAIITGASAKYAEILKYVHHQDGRVYAGIGEDQASGRWAMTRPSLTNLGKRGGKVVQRAPFLPEEGHVLISCDLDQVDMRAIAGHCQDPAYMALFGPGRDAHAEIADLVYGRHDGEWREMAKKCGHGEGYGMGVNGLVGQGVERAVATQFVEMMAERFPRRAAWREEVREKAAAGELLDNGFGRRMRCDPARSHTQGPALMGQGTARDLMCEALLRLEASVPESVGWLRGVVHDEVVLSVPAGDVEEISREVVKAFTFEWRGVPITSGVSRPGRAWHECYAKD